MKSLVLCAALAFCFSTAHAEETIGEKTKATAKDAGAAVTKGAHRVGEEVCEMVNGKMKCVGKKIKNRASEAGTAVKNKAEEVKDSVD